MNTKIEWADHTFNPWTGCTKVSRGCDHCYAEGWAKRSGQVEWGPRAQRRRTSEANWRQPLRWNAQAEREGRRARVFCASLADVFDNEAFEPWRWDLFRLIAATPHLDWLLLTKRIGNARTMLNSAASAVAGEFVGALEWDRAPWPNVWLGVTVTSQAEADRDIPKLLATPAAVRFLSIEPMLGPIDLTRLSEDTCASECCGMQYLNGLSGESICDLSQAPFDAGPRIDWVIVGGESGPVARPMHPDWVRSLRNQCTRWRVPFLFKQWGEWGLFEQDAATVGAKPKPGNAHVWSDEAVSWRVGKKSAGRLLDGRTWDEVPS